MCVVRADLEVMAPARLLWDSTAGIDVKIAGHGIGKL